MIEALGYVAGLLFGVYCLVQFIVRPAMNRVRAWGGGQRD